MRVVCMIVARYADDHQGPSRHLTWLCELHMRALTVEMFTILAEEEMDGELEADLASSFGLHSVVLPQQKRLHLRVPLAP